MVILDVPKFLPNRTIRWVRATIAPGEIVCKDDFIKREVQKIKAVQSSTPYSPNPDWTLGDMIVARMAARIIEKTSGGTDGPAPPGIIF